LKAHFAGTFLLFRATKHLRGYTWTFSLFGARGRRHQGRDTNGYRFASACLSACVWKLVEQSRPAKVGDKLRTVNFNTGTRGFAAPEDSTTAVCVLPGTELAFSEEVKCAPAAFGFSSWRTKTVNFRTAIFRQVNKDVPRVHHDALEFPDGTCVLLTELREGQEATVLQLPAQPKTPAEEAAQKRVTYVG